MNTKRTQQTPGSRNTSAKPVAIAAAVVGGIALLGAGTTAAIATVGSLRADSGGGASSTQSVDVAGIAGIDVDSAGTLLTVEFGDVDEAVLEVSGADRDGRWTLDRDGDELVLERHGRPFGDWCFGFCEVDRRATVLTLPEELNDGSLNAGIGAGAGTVTVDGEFGEVDVQVGAGEVFLSGAARTLGVNVGAGTADIDLEGVSDARLEASAGEVFARFTGAAPDRVGVDVAVGTADLRLPEAEYDVHTRAAVGDVVNELRTSSDSSHLIEANVSAGEIFLRQGD